MRAWAPWVAYNPRKIQQAAGLAHWGRRSVVQTRRSWLPHAVRAVHDTLPSRMQLPTTDAPVPRVEPAPRAPTTSLWSLTLPPAVQTQFVRQATKHLAAGECFRTATEAAAPAFAQLDGTDGAVRREELQCMLLSRVVSQRLLSLSRISAAWYPDDAFDPTLHYVPPDAAQELRRFQRASLYRLFRAQIEARRLYAAACVLLDRRLRPAQPKHLLATLLTHTARLRTLPPLAVDPQQSARVALRQACAAMEARPPQTLRGSVAVSMLHQLAALHMYSTLLRWARVLTHTHVTDMDPDALTGIVQQLCHERMYAEAYTFLQTLPLAWRTPGMYPPLVGHYANVMLDSNGLVQSSLPTPDTRLWHELCTVAHLAPPDAPAYLARLASHAKKARALHALRDERLVRRVCSDDASVCAAASLYTLRALVRAGRWSLAVRYARRCLRRDGPPPNATAWLNTLVGGLVRARRTRTSTPEQRRHLLSYLYRAVLRPVPVHSGRRLPYITSQSGTLDPLVDAISQLIPALHARPNRTTLLLLIRAAAQWGENLDSRALRRMAQLILPEGRQLHTLTDTPSAIQGALLVELAAAFARRADHRSARRAHFLARQKRRRVRRSTGLAPRALPPHRS